ncbi:bifunctional DNA primase/polymerase [Paludisphaera rhizosphaerae]|uniref:bifunctional DNA primase/polymerase n=1 Tax=Paludisphaera rhizosphaerae TaxID=2711216 RepID=UPI0013EE17F2|nr:bifunctional DNA primase/polymerase [Paludisphaera rhizosphaerae]
MISNGECDDKCHSTRIALDAAIEYARAGFRVVPCHPRAKEPAIAGWQHRATDDERMVRHWFENGPYRNVALLMGGGVFAVDLDGDEGVESWGRLVHGRKVPCTATAATGGGGWHYLFRTTQKIAPRVGVETGVDIRGDGSIIVVAPSIHPETGNAYRWVYHPGDVAIALAPGWLLDRIHDREAVTSDLVRPPAMPTHDRPCEDVDALAAKVIDRFPVQRLHSRNARMLRATAFLIGQNYRLDVVAAALERWWLHFYVGGTIGTDPREAPGMIGQTIESMVKAGNIRLASAGVDHEAAIRAVELTPALAQIVSSTPNVTPIGMGGEKPIPKELHPLRSENDRWFLEALGVHFTYERGRSEGDRLKATNGQLRNIIRDRHSVVLNPNQMERLKRRYITRPGKPAERWEAAVQVATGDSSGKTCEFELTGLLELLDPRPTDAAVPSEESPCPISVAS